MIDPAVLAPDPERRSLVVAALEAGLAAVEPAGVVAAHAGDLAQHRGDLAVLAVGKAAAAMCRGLAGACPDARLTGLAVSEHAEALPDGVDFVQAGHPDPDQRSVAAGRRALELVGSLAAGRNLVVLVSGGGSALLEVPASGLQLEDLAATADLLMRAGAPIGDLNLVRRHLSAVKGGRLAAAARHLRLVTLALSDVPGGRVDVIASGPTVPDPSTTAGDAIEVLRRHKVADVAPRSVLEHLRRGTVPVEPHPEHRVAVVADGAAAASAAAERLAATGLTARVAPTALAGEARAAGLEAVAATRPGTAAVFAGETTVTVVGAGYGGRNQEAALAVALDIAGAADVVFAALATDGVDGPTPAAGAIVDGGSTARMGRAGRDPARDLAGNDSHRALASSGDLVVTGPTGTNVADLWVVLRSVTSLR